MIAFVTALFFRLLIRARRVIAFGGRAMQVDAPAKYLEFTRHTIIRQKPRAV